MKGFNASNHKSINYLYFLLFFIYLVIVYSFHILNVASHDTFPRAFFWSYAVLESFLQTLVFIISAYFIRFYLPKWFFWAFIGFSFIYLFAVTMDLLLTKFMGLSVWGGLELFRQESFDNFLEMLFLSGVPLEVYLMIFGLIVLLPTLGIALYYLTDLFSKRFPFYVHPKNMTSTLFGGFILLIVGETVLSPFFSLTAYREYEEALPWKTTLLEPKLNVINFSNTMTPPPNENDYNQIYASLPELKSKNAPIFLFVIESLRNDFLNEEVAPNLYAFSHENYSCELSFSNANATHLSWYSIFFSEFSYYWNASHSLSWKEGAIPLRILKDSGYKIGVFSATGLYYYKMDNSIFGAKHQLIDEAFIYPHYDPIKPYQSDQKVFETVISKIQKGDGLKEVFIIFLDSTHFQYSWPEQDTKFTPYSDELEFVSVVYTDASIGKVKNRYKNSIHFVDRLFGEFIRALKDQGIYEESIIIVTGDHGEEFLEKGKLFHASQLNFEQTFVPIYYKLGNMDQLKDKISERSVTSHMDIFPTVIDYVFDSNQYAPLFKGESLLREVQWPYVVSTKYNAGQRPYEFLITDGKVKLLGRFQDKREVLSSKAIEVLDLTDIMDRSLYPSLQSDSTHRMMYSQFKPGLQRMFNTQPL